MPQQRLNRPYIHPRLQEVRGEAVAQSVEAHRLRNPRLLFRQGEGSLDYGRVQ